MHVAEATNLTVLSNSPKVPAVGCWPGTLRSGPATSRQADVQRRRDRGADADNEYEHDGSQGIADEPRALAAAARISAEDGRR